MEPKYKIRLSTYYGRNLHYSCDDMVYNTFAEADEYARVFFENTCKKLLNDIDKYKDIKIHRSTPDNPVYRIDGITIKDDTFITEWRIEHC